MRTHIPDSGKRRHLTYCGRPLEAVPVIDTEQTALEAANCRKCQAVDDMRAIQSFHRSQVFRRSARRG